MLLRSLILRASQPCPAASARETWQKDFVADSFSTAALHAWLTEVGGQREMQIQCKVNEKSMKIQ